MADYGDRSTWKKCSLCGKYVHPLQESSAEPLSHGIACPSCAIGKVNPTRRNNGIPSHISTERNRDGKLVAKIIPDREDNEK